jgi:tRNA-Thr(GGU) m(6)t(6)A37 methyltransferase TsaA
MDQSASASTKAQLHCEAGGFVDCKPIGIIRSPFSRREGMPIQPTGARGVAGRVEIDPAYVNGLDDLDGFSHIILLYHFHASEGFELTVVPFMDSVPRGLFATRAPRRPNPIGLSIVRLLRVEGAVLHIEDLDILDGTPLLDIKPYVPDFDSRSAVQTGWLQRTSAAVSTQRSDKRFL